MLRCIDINLTFPIPGLSFPDSIAQARTRPRLDANGLFYDSSGSGGSGLEKPHGPGFEEFHVFLLQSGRGLPKGEAAIASTNNAHGPVTSSGCPVPFSALGPFLLVTFGIAWGILGLFIFQPVAMEALFGPLTGQSPFFFLCVYAPAIAAFALVAWYGGRRGMTRFLGRFLLWRAPVPWYVFLFLGIPAIFYAGAALKGTLAGNLLVFDSTGALFAALAFTAIKGPVEEFGWRGVALPLLQRKMPPFWAGLVLGAIWGLWHLPAFLLGGTQQSQWSFAPFFAGCIAISIIATALFNETRGSILLAAVFHFMLMNPVFPEAQPYDSILLMVVAAVVVWRRRATMFAREGSVVAVVPK